MAAGHEPQLDGRWRGGWQYGHAVQPIDIARQLVAQFQHVLHFLQAFMLAGSFFELHLLAQPVARIGDRALQRLAVAAQEFEHSLHFVPVLGRAHHLLARPQAQVHFAIDAAGVLRGRRQVFLAAAHLEQIQELRFEPLRRYARAERSEVQSRRARKVRRDQAARILVLQHDFHVRRHAQLE